MEAVFSSYHHLFELVAGTSCVCHRAQRCLAAALEKEDSPAYRLVKKVKGIVAHFHRSNKVKTLLPFFLWGTVLILSTPFPLGNGSLGADFLAPYWRVGFKATPGCRNSLGRVSTHAFVGPPEEGWVEGV